MTLLQFLPPMRSRSGDLLIDGGYSNNLPCDIMRDLHCPDILIGADIENKHFYEMFKNVTDFGENLSGWWLLWARMWVRGDCFFSKRSLPPSECVGATKLSCLE